MMKAPLGWREMLLKAQYKLAAKQGQFRHDKIWQPNLMLAFICFGESIAAMKKYFRVEIYKGCSLTLSGRFESREVAEQYRDSILASVTRIIEVDSDGAAIEK